MEKKKIYVSPLVEITTVAYEGHLCENTGIPNSDQGQWGGTGAKKHQWSDWDDDVEDVGQSAGTGKSALELPSGGKLWDD